MLYCPVLHGLRAGALLPKELLILEDACSQGILTARAHVDAISGEMIVAFENGYMPAIYLYFDILLFSITPVLTQAAVHEAIKQL